MHAPGFWNIILILAIVVLMFGGKKLPELGGAFGEALKNFKKAVKDVESTAANPPAAPQAQPQAQSQAPTMEAPKALPQAQPQTEATAQSQTASGPQA